MTGAERRARLARARLYLCMPLRDELRAFLDAVLAGGVDVVQLRDKDATDDEVLRAAPAFRAACDVAGALFIVNDRPDLAVATGADGVHLGQDDEPVDAARAVVGGEALIGRSTHAPDEVDAAREEDVDYLGVGPVHETPTKPGRPGTGLALVRYAAAHAARPFFVTGGMDEVTAGNAMRAGAHGIVVVRAIVQAADPGAAAARIARAIDAARAGSRRSGVRA